MRGIGIVALVAALFVPACGTVRCFQCTDSLNPSLTYTENCGYDFSSAGVPVVECRRACRKMEANTIFGKGLTRSCYDNTTSTRDECITSGSAPFGEVTDCVCFSDLCNAAEMMMSSFLVLASSVMVFVMLNREGLRNM